MESRYDQVWGSLLSGCVFLAVFLFILNRHEVAEWARGSDLLSNIDTVRFVFLSGYFVNICFWGALGFKKALKKGLDARLWGAVCIASGIIGYIILLFRKP